MSEGTKRRCRQLSVQPLKEEECLTVHSCSIVLLFVTASAQSQIHYQSFRNTTGLNLVGGATVVGNKIRLVPAQRDTRGNFWTQKAFPVARGFHSSFAFRYSHQGGSKDGNGNPGNDGLLFYIQPVSNVLQQNMEIPAKSLCIFFDGYKNNNVGDISSSRVEVLVNAQRIGQVDVEPLGIRFRDGRVVRARVEYDGHCLTVFLNDKPVGTYKDVDLNEVSPGYVGFHGMGGDAYADVDVLNLHFDSL